MGCMDKLNRVDRVANSLTVDELERRLPEIDLIGDEQIAADTARVFLQWCPDYFWEKRASKNHHAPDERGEYGNWLHTKRVFLEYNTVARSWTEQQLITAREYHCGQAACLLHDMMRYGWPSENNSYSVNNHDRIMAEIIRQRSALPEPVAAACDSHMGSWGEGPLPQSNLEQLVHTADMVASADYNDIGVFMPSKELKELGVTEVDFDE